MKLENFKDEPMDVKEEIESDGEELHEFKAWNLLI